MPLDYDFLKGLPPLEIDHSYDWKDTALYALGIGAGIPIGDAPVNLDFVYESGLKALPTWPLMMAYPGFWARDPKYGITWQKLLHVEQSIEIHGPIPVEGKVRGFMTIDEIYDRGAEKGALLHFSRRIVDAETDALIAIVRQVNLLRADGGFGGPAIKPPAPRDMPTRAADCVVEMASRPEQAMIYRLSGDTNPLHIDPKISGAAGFETPILHGLATMGIVGRAALKILCNDDPARMAQLDVRFAAPVFPGETLAVSIWDEGNGHAAIEAKVVERDIVVIRNGYCAYQG